LFLYGFVRFIKNTTIRSLITVPVVMSWFTIPPQLPIPTVRFFLGGIVAIMTMRAIDCIIFHPSENVDRPISAFFIDIFAPKKRSYNRVAALFQAFNRIVWALAKLSIMNFMVLYIIREWPTFTHIYTSTLKSNGILSSNATDADGQSILQLESPGALLTFVSNPNFIYFLVSYTKYCGYLLAMALYYMMQSGLLDIVQALVNIISGETFDYMWKYPFFATSPKDFWSRRWNVLFRELFHGSVFRPFFDLTKSTALSAIAVFIASGIIHEMEVYLSFWEVTGENMLFFIINCFFCMIQTQLERTIHQGKDRQRKIYQWNLLEWLVTLCLIVPCAHFYFAPYNRHDYWETFVYPTLFIQDRATVDKLFS